MDESLTHEMGGLDALSLLSLLSLSPLSLFSLSLDSLDVLSILCRAREARKALGARIYIYLSQTFSSLASMVIRGSFSLGFCAPSTR